MKNIEQSHRDGEEAHASKGARLQIRVDKRMYSMLERAAEIEHMSISEYVRSSSIDSAKKTIKENEVIHLSNRDWDAFYEALTNPPGPNRKLVEAYRRYKGRKNAYYAALKQENSQTG